jgi:aldehyde:ferredoxin oxidoreductase
MMYGWIGKVLRVNLTEGTVKTEKLNAEWQRLFRLPRPGNPLFCC